MKFKQKLILVSAIPLSLITLISCENKVEYKKPIKPNIETTEPNKEPIETKKEAEDPNKEATETKKEATEANKKPIETKKEATEHNDISVNDFYNFDDFLNPDNGFVHKNFFTKKVEDNKYQKFYRFYKFIYEDKWRKKNDKFVWSIELDEINKILNKDKEVENPTIWFYTDVRDNVEDLDKFHSSATDRPIFNGIPKFEFKNQQNFSSIGSKEKYNKLKFQIGISFNLNDFLKKNIFKFKLKNNYEIEAKLEDNKINFYLSNSVAKLSDDITFVRNTYQAYQNLKNEEKSSKEDLNNLPNIRLLMPNNSFVSLSFTTDNKENKTIEKYIYPSQYTKETITYDKQDKIIENDDKRYEWLPKTVDIFPDDWINLVDPNPSKTFVKNPNAFDKSTQDPLTSFDNALNKTMTNNFVNSMERILNYNKFDPRIEDLQVRSFGNRGTYTMIAKVKPHDDEDQRYYVLSNRHVVDSIWADIDGDDTEEQVQEKLKRAKTSTYNWPLKDGEELTNNVLYKVPVEQWNKRPLYGKTEFETKYNISTSNFFESFLKVVWVPNNIKTKPVQFQDNPEEKLATNTIDMAISIIDLKPVFTLLDRALLDQTLSLPYVQDIARKEEKQRIIDWLTGTKNDLEKWKTLEPLKFGNSFANLNNGEYLTNFYISAYPRQRTNVVYKINKVNYLESRITYHHDYYLHVLGADNKPILTQPGPPRGNGLVGGASGSLIVDQQGNIQAIHSLAMDVFGDSYEYNNGTDVAFPFISKLRDVISYDKDNPNTFGSWLKQKAKEDPQHFEELDIYINPQKYWKN
ncbi:hypothetical protein [Mycoplasma sp. 1654_15]|uniref:hypothetical protein n=1 Tax=Mycoplasma sp. 1654_15 TaxID=2725994 RepID=UPI001449BF09|nr:hypothetical protein [Mycoplasma sp. 1654_15]QJB71296.1 hypothetical protein HF996_02270 [Mycoplasma sp. 1654_15]